MTESGSMESLVSGTLAGMGSFRCERCGYVVSLEAGDALPPCPGCAGERFTRASLFSAHTAQTRAVPTPDDSSVELEYLLEAAAPQLEQPGQYLVYREAGGAKVVPLVREWTRVGRSLAADVRFDDPTVSRRHALIVRQADGVRVLDDRSLNGIFVNGDRVEWRVLADGDEIVVGRYRLHFVDVTPERAAAGLRGGGATALSAGG
ncbi:MAG TPA: FHA domain-containing protein [Solirubrobacteraceae bacterium]|nr:FHA domain-containing protein [Solirubrobacteraceae bacterium]